MKKRFSIPSLEHTARESLAAQNFPPSKVAMVYTGAVVGISLLSVLLSVVLGLRIDQIQGLSGRGTREALATAQTILDLLPMILLPFLQLGYLRYTLAVINRRDTSCRTLLEGFPLWGKLIGCGIWKGLATVAVGYVLYMPLGSVYLLLHPLPENAVENMLTTGAVPQDIAGPLLAVIAVSFGASAIFFGFFFRLLHYCLADRPDLPVFILLRRAASLMRGRVGAFLLLDLRHWWYWLLKGLAQVLLYLDLILGFLEIPLPLPAAAANVICYALWALVELLSAWLFLNRVKCTYAAAYTAAAASSPLPAPRAR